MLLLQEWSEDESEEEEEESQQPISREDSGIQVDRTPQEDQERNDKMAQVTWTGKRTGLAVEAVKRRGRRRFTGRVYYCSGGTGCQGLAGAARGDAVLGSSLVTLSTQPPSALQPSERLVRRNRPVRPSLLP